MSGFWMLQVTWLVRPLENRTVRKPNTLWPFEYPTCLLFEFPLHINVVKLTCPSGMPEPTTREDQMQIWNVLQLDILLWAFARRRLSTPSRRTLVWLCVFRARRPGCYWPWCLPLLVEEWRLKADGDECQCMPKINFVPMVNLNNEH